MYSTFIALLDDIVTLTKIAASKTIPVLGDDLAVNAEKLSGGIRPERELPVIYAVFKWSMLNKFIVISIALLLSATIPSAIPYLLIAGALFLLFEGGCALFDVLFRPAHLADGAAKFTQAILDETVDMVAFEKEKIRGAIVTDLVLSAEIIVIALGAMTGQSFITQAGALIGIGVCMTLGVYGLVALIVKLDDMGLALQKDGRPGVCAASKRYIGRGLLELAVWVMRVLPVIGVVAMFMVGSDILAHEVHWLHQGYEHLSNAVTLAIGGASAVVLWLAKLSLGALAGLAMAGIEKLWAHNAAH